MNCFFSLPKYLQLAVVLGYAVECCLDPNSEPDEWIPWRHAIPANFSKFRLKPEQGQSDLDLEVLYDLNKK